MLEKFDKACGLLPVKLPVTIKIVSKENLGAVAEYEPRYSRKGKLKGHRITMYLPEMRADLRDFDTLLAHELIHAWQEEKGLVEVHGKQFAKMAVKLTAHLGLRGIFDPSIDKP